MEDIKLTSGEKGYVTRITNSLEQNFKLIIKEKTEEYTNELNEIVKLKENVENKISEVNKIITRLEDKENTADETLEEIKDVRDKIYEPDVNDIVLADEIETFIEENNNFNKKTSSIYEELRKYKKAILGYKDEKGKQIEGLKHKFDQQINSFQNLYQLNEEKQKELFQRIEGLLKGASTVALSKSFNEHKESFNISNWVWIFIFIISIGSMMGLSVWGFVNADYKFEEMWKYTLGNIPFLAGAVWLAVYSSKQRSQNKRLQQEYAYKEDVAKIYYGLKQEIESMGKTEIGTKLNQQILETIISVVAENPSNTLESKSHEDKGPILESIEKLVEVHKLKI